MLLVGAIHKVYEVTEMRLNIAIAATCTLGILCTWPSHIPAQTITLSPRVDYDIGASCYDPIALDINGDGVKDLAAPQHGSGNVVFLLNDGHGAFAITQAVPAFGGNQSSVVGDFDGDGDDDLAVTGYHDHAVGILRNDSGWFSLVQALTVAGVDRQPTGIATGDFDRDGDLDIACGNGGAHIGDAELVILLNDGAGLFQLDQTIAFVGGSAAWYVVSADMDGDGDLDLLTREGQFAVVLNRGDGTFDTPIRVPVPFGLQEFVARDLDGDGDLDVAGTEPGTDAVIFLDNLGSAGGVWNGFAPFTSYGSGGLDPHGIAAVDLDADGDLDLAVSNITSSEVTILVNDGAGVFTLDGVFPAPPNMRRMDAADFDGDGVEDLFGGYDRGVYVFLDRTAVKVDVSIHPRTLQLRSNGNWVTCFITALAPDSVTGLDASTPQIVEVNGVPVPPIGIAWSNVEDQDGDGQLETLMVKFNRASLAAVMQPGMNVMTIRGRFTDGRAFTGSDEIRAKE